ncbi:Transcription factor TFIIIB component B'' Myb domain-containing protein [Entamoeba marina]
MSVFFDDCDEVCLGMAPGVNVDTEKPVRRIKRKCEKWSFKKNYKWTKETTALFYEALYECGANFEKMQQMIGVKEIDRTAIKMKYKNEEKNRPQLVTAAMNGKMTVALKCIISSPGTRSVSQTSYSEDFELGINRFD